MVAMRTFVSRAGKKYHRSPRTHFELITHMHAGFSAICTFYRMKISTKLYILSKKDYADCENYYFEKIMLTVR